MAKLTLLLLGIFYQLLNIDTLPLANSYDLAPKGLQIIPHRDGYIPVFIRVGDTPLEKINPQLAEAFRHHEKTANRTTPKPTSNSSSPELTPNQASLYKLFVNGYKLKMNATNYRFNDLSGDEDKGPSHIQKIYKIPIVRQQFDDKNQF